MEIKFHPYNLYNCNGTNSISSYHVELLVDPKHKLYYTLGTFNRWVWINTALNNSKNNKIKQY